MVTNKKKKTSIGKLSNTINEVKSNVNELDGKLMALLLWAISFLFHLLFLCLYTTSPAAWEALSDVKVYRVWTSMLNGKLQSFYICPFSSLLLRSYFTHSAYKHCVSEWKDIRSEAQLILSSPRSETMVAAQISVWVKSLSVCRHASWSSTSTRLSSSLFQGQCIPSVTSPLTLRTLQCLWHGL